jgi:hypothetical protein
VDHSDVAWLIGCSATVLVTIVICVTVLLYGRQ